MTMKAHLYLLTAIFLCSPAVTTTAEENQKLFDITVAKPIISPGEYVLCPSRQFYEAALKKGANKTTFIYYAATLVEAGDAESKVKSLAGTEYSLPNELIISIPKGMTAKVGDILLTWWQSGSGMQRAIVVGGTPTEPVVRYLDIAYDNPSGAGKKEDTLKPDTFSVLTEPWQIGTTVTVKVGTQQRFGHLLAADQKKILIREFAGKLAVHERSSATPVPLRPVIAPDGAAKAALFGSLKPITVIKVDEKIGRVFSTYQLGRTEKEKAFAFGEVVPE